jgi:hypothetical protein
MSWRVSRVVCGIGLSLVSASGCRKSSPAAEAAPSASVAPVAPASSEAPSAASPAPSAVSPGSALGGTWSGSYRAEHHLIQMDKKEALPAWVKDDQKVGVGDGKLELVIDANGSVSGTSSGPLGELAVSGRAEDGMVRATLSPRDPSVEGGFQGYLMAHPARDRIAGQLEISSADGAVVRRASVELGRRQ